MGLKNKIYFFAIGVIMIFSCGCTQKNIDDEYLIISNESNICVKYIDNTFYIDRLSKLFQDNLYKRFKR